MEDVRKNLQIDMGKEFYNANVQKILKKHDINLFNILINEGVSRTVQSYVKKRHVKLFTYNENYKWIDLLLRLISRYNARTISVRRRCYSRDRLQAFNHSTVL